MSARQLRLGLVLLGAGLAAGAAEPGPPHVRRFAENPIITPAMLPGTDGANINGPSLLRAPDWLPGRLGTYYLYFAHHNGKYIRLAYADALTGPWRIHAGGVLPLAEAPGVRGHLASPDVHVDEQRHELRLYFHGPAKAGGGQQSFVARSADGLRFTAGAEPLGLFYFRAFAWGDQWYALAKGGWLYRSRDGLTQFESGPNPFPGGEERERVGNTPGPRHVAVQRVGDALWVYYTNIGDAPERILRRRVALSADWRDWRAGPAQEVLRPEFAYEGSDLPLRKSQAGAAAGREHALRDPGVFVDRDGRVYLLYSVAGEHGLALAELTEQP